MSTWRHNIIDCKSNYKISKKWRLGIVTARFNNHITDKLLSGAISELKKCGVKERQITAVAVPGAVEISLAAQWLLEQKYDGVIALGAVIRGETTHYDYVCTSVERGCTTLQLKYGKPVVFGVLTTENEEQAVNRVGGTHGHKGVEAAHVLLDMLNLELKIKNKKTLKKEKKHGRK